jgi:hypothetical protein
LELRINVIGFSIPAIYAQKYHKDQTAGYLSLNPCFGDMDFLNVQPVGHIRLEAILDQDEVPFLMETNPCLK